MAGTAATATAILGLVNALENDNAIGVLSNALSLTDGILTITDSTLFGGSVTDTVLLDDVTFGNTTVDVTAGQALSIASFALALDSGDARAIATSAVQVYSQFGGQVPGVQYLGAAFQLVDGDVEGAAVSAASTYFLDAAISSGNGYAIAVAIVFAVFSGELTADPPPDPSANLDFTRLIDGSIGFDTEANETGYGLKSVLDNAGSGIADYLEALEDQYYEFLLPLGDESGYDPKPDPLAGVENAHLIKLAALGLIELPGFTPTAEANESASGVNPPPASQYGRDPSDVVAFTTSQTRIPVIDPTTGLPEGVTGLTPVTGLSPELLAQLNLDHAGLIEGLQGLSVLPVDPNAVAAPNAAAAPGVDQWAQEVVESVKPSYAPRLNVDDLPKLYLWAELEDQETQHWTLRGGKNLNATIDLGINPEMDEVARILRDAVLISHQHDGWYLGEAHILDPLTGKGHTETYYSPFASLIQPSITRAVPVGAFLFSAQTEGAKEVVVATDITSNPIPPMTVQQSLKEVHETVRLGKDLFAGDQGARALAIYGDESYARVEIDIDTRVWV